MTQILIKVQSEEGVILMDHRLSSNEVDSIKDLAMKQYARIVLNDRQPRSFGGPNGTTFEVSIA